MLPNSSLTGTGLRYMNITWLDSLHSSLLMLASGIRSDYSSPRDGFRTLGKHRTSHYPGSLTLG